jgi:hypothetical protein
VRSYLVIPEGTSVIRVDASSPQFAASKARNGKGEPVMQDEPVVLPVTRLRVAEAPSRTIPGQLVIEIG